MLQNWIVEAKQIKSKDDFSMDLLYQTNDISDFLNRSDINSISATKGFGKTFALKIKSINYRDSKSGSVFIPKKQLVDKFIPQNKPSISKELKKQFNSIDKHTALWKVAILISVIANTDLLDEVESLCDETPALKTLFNKKFSKSVQLTYCYFLTNYSIFNEIAFKSNGIIRELVAIVGLLKNGIYIFLDNIDEFYLDEKNFVHEGDIWFNSQIALIKCVYQIDQISSHLHIYFTTRKRVLDRLQKDDSMYSQYKSSISKIIYAKHELKKIFTNNIRNEREERLIHPSQVFEKPMLSFLGVTEIPNISQKKQRIEDIFDYIYRHTFGRPRDLMTLGKSISLLSIKSRQKEELLRKKVNETSYDIGQQYILELKHFIQLDFDSIYKLINKNILSTQEIKIICCKYNGIEPNSHCINCTKKINVFSILYLQGLIGYEYYDQFSRSWHQSFITTGQQYIDGTQDLLPVSKKYFIHPCFTEVIKDYRTKNGLSRFIPNRDTIVGNGIEITKNNENNIIPIKIFLASSEELLHERDRFDLNIHRLNNSTYRKKGVELEIIRWENFIDAMSIEGLQAEYNRTVENADIFIMLFFTKVGKFTQEEFEKAFLNYKRTGKPLVYTYFKDANIKTSELNGDTRSLLDFNDKLTELGHYHKKFENADSLNHYFGQQLEKILPSIVGKELF